MEKQYKIFSYVLHNYNGFADGIMPALKNNVTRRPETQEKIGTNFSTQCRIFKRFITRLWDI